MGFGDAIDGFGNVIGDAKDLPKHLKKALQDLARDLGRAFDDLPNQFSSRVGYVGLPDQRYLEKIAQLSQKTIIENIRRIIADIDAFGGLDAVIDSEKTFEAAGKLYGVSKKIADTGAVQKLIEGLDEAGIDDAVESFLSTAGFYRAAASAQSDSDFAKAHLMARLDLALDALGRFRKALNNPGFAPASAGFEADLKLPPLLVALGKQRSDARVMLEALIAKAPPEVFGVLTQVAPPNALSRLAELLDVATGQLDTLFPPAGSGRAPAPDAGVTLVDVALALQLAMSFGTWVRGVIRSGISSIQLSVGPSFSASVGASIGVSGGESAGVYAGVSVSESTGGGLSFLSATVDVVGALAAVPAQLHATVFGLVQAAFDVVGWHRSQGLIEILDDIKEAVEAK